MRLLRCTDDGFTLTKDFRPHEERPEYAILSHRWGLDDEEVTHADLVNNAGETKVGYEKLRFCARQTKQDNLLHFWVDTCCIDKTNQVELQEAIISMFSWYKSAARCYVYLPDIAATRYNLDERREWEHALRENEWFRRGWTLQELIAPASVEFFTKEGRRLGDKVSLQQLIHDITTIPISVLQNSDVSSYDVDERFRWAESRRTTREEDAAYCLLGIFGVSMPVLYGETKNNAVRRLKEEVAASIQRGDLLRHQGTIPFFLPSTAY